MIEKQVAEIVFNEAQQQYLSFLQKGRTEFMDSAKICLEDCEYLRNKGDYQNMINRGIAALRYLVGIEHPAYTTVMEAISKINKE